MTDDDGAQGVHHVHPTPARTPFPRRLLLIGRVRRGQEVQVRYWQARFPATAAAAAGIGAVEAFVGSGYYALALEIAGADSQAVLAAYFNDPAVQAFHGHLHQFVEGLPVGDQPVTPADAFHGHAAGAAESSASVATAELPLAAGMYRWRQGEEPQTGDDVLLAGPPDHD